MQDNNKHVHIKRALISVSDKSGIVDFAHGLVKLGVEILSTGGTHKLLVDNGIAAIEISDYTGFPEMMSGRVKTLHPKVHGGILARRGIDDDVMQRHSINPIDMVVVNLYPFEQTIAKPDCDLATAIENIDIGGPTMVRAAAKNHKDVAIVVNASSYTEVLKEMQNDDGKLSYATRFDLATQAFEHTAAYDGAIANYLGKKVLSEDEIFPRTVNLQFKKVQQMRYGENPHQKAAFYVESSMSEASVASAQQLQGKEMSFNNVADTDAALETVKQFSMPACVIVKHANPCGVAEAEDIESAYEKAFTTDPESAFGGIIAFNRTLDCDTAQKIIDKQFVEVIIAPKVAEGVPEIVASKKNVRLLRSGEWSTNNHTSWDFKRVTGGMLIQERDNGMITVEDLGFEVKGSVMASDAFFPFRDGIDNAAAVGIHAVIQPGGSMRDEEVIAAANEHDIAMVFTRMRHFRH